MIECPIHGKLPGKKCFKCPDVEISESQAHPLSNLKMAREALRVIKHNLEKGDAERALEIVREALDNC